MDDPRCDKQKLGGVYISSTCKMYTKEGAEDIYSMKCGTSVLAIAIVTSEQGEIFHVIPIEDGAIVKKDLDFSIKLDWVYIYRGVIQKNMKRLTLTDQGLNKSIMDSTPRDTYICAIGSDNESPRQRTVEMKHEKVCCIKKPITCESILRYLFFTVNPVCELIKFDDKMIVHICIPIFKTGEENTILHPIYSYST